MMDYTDGEMEAAQGEDRNARGQREFPLSLKNYVDYEVTKLDIAVVCKMHQNGIIHRGKTGEKVWIARSLVQSNL